jgi:hypothetical protein
MEPGGVRARRAATLWTLVALFLLSKLRLLGEPAIWLGWNSDSAIFGLMANRMRAGAGFDVFFWGQGYLGTLTPALAALLRAAALDPLGTSPAAGPLALRLASMLQVAFGIGFSFLAVDRLFGFTAALLAGAWLAISPPFLVGCSAVAMGPEVPFAIGSVLLFLTADALTRTPALLDGPAGRFAFGLAGGVGWWVHQTVAFVLVPCALILFLRSPASAAAFETLRHWRRRGREAASASLRRATRAIFPAAAGFAVGYLPVWLGGLVGWYPAAYTFTTPLLPEPGWGARLGRFLVADGRRLVGLEDGVVGAVVYGAAFAAIAFLLVRNRRKLLSLLRLAPGPVGGIALVTAVVLAGTYFFILRERLPAQIRYLAPVLPSALALAGAAALEAVRLVRGKPGRTAAGLVAACTAVAGLLVLGRNAGRAVSEICADADPRPLLRTIEASGYRVCHADYWVAYKLQFLSDERIRFIPWHSFDRNRRESARLRAEPGLQGLVLPDGTVRPWTAADAADEGGPRRRREPSLTPSTRASPGRAPSS